jgi:hypothetical protein
MQYPDYNEMLAYARQSAQERGIDPYIGIKALRTEGLAPNVWQSNYYRNGKREPSYGPGQLLVGGPGTGYGVGLGNAFIQKYGKHPSDPSTWKENIDFTFDNVAKNGWKDWYGPRKIGITGKMGVISGPMRLGPGEEPMNKSGKGDKGDLSGLPANPVRTPLEEAWIREFGALPVEGLQTSEGTNKRDSGDFTPMQQAMNLAPYGDGGITSDNTGPSMDMALDGPPGPQQGNPYGNMLKRGLLGAGAGLQSIDNPGGAMVGLKLLEGMDSESMTPYQRAMLAMRGMELANKQDKLDSKAAEDQAAGLQRMTAIRDQWGDMMNIAKEIRDAPNLKDITGWMSYVPNAPEGEARALQAKLDNFRSRGIFNFLTGLRQLSTTGGALGQVSDFENRLMEKAFAALDQAQGAEAFQKALNDFMAQAERSMTNINKAFEAQYGTSLPGYEPLNPQSGGGGVNPNMGGGEKVFDASDYF